jgi:2'-5' RNA ligase
MRAFLALRADPEWVDSCRGLVDTLRPVSPPAAWTRPESWHLTLRFFAEISPAAADAFARDVEPLVKESEGGALEAGGAVAFPGPRHPRVLGIGFREGPGLTSLAAIARGAEEAARRSGASPESRPFRAHVTLARLRTPWPSPAVEHFLQTVRDRAFPSWALRACVLFESRLGPSGAVHTPLHAFAFARMREEVGA